MKWQRGLMRGRGDGGRRATGGDGRGQSRRGRRGACAVPEGGGGLRVFDGKWSKRGWLRRQEEEGQGEETARGGAADGDGGRAG